MTFFILFTAFASAQTLEKLNVLDMLANQKRGIEEYKRAIIVENGSTQPAELEKGAIHINHSKEIFSFHANNGLNDYGYKLMENDCLHNIAKRLYNEINNLPEEKFSGERRRPVAINEKSSVASFKPGFFWERALYYAGGDPNLAFTLIGLCGGDNRESMPICPGPDSIMFTPESLGTGVNTPQPTIDKVIQVQGDEGRADFIPAKYYHLMGAASTSCLMLRRGVSPAVARPIVGAAANAYRIGRICNDQILDKSDARRGDLFYDLLLRGKKSPHYKNIGREWEEIYSPEVVAEKLKIRASDSDAREILLSVSKVRAECKAAGVSGTLGQMLMTKSYRSGKNICPSRWPTERCERALHRLDTWAMDREWTEAQHLAGFEFAVKNCQPTVTGDGNQEMFRLACRAQELLDQSSKATPKIPGRTVQ